MKFIKINTDSVFIEKNLCLAIGNFDGVHKGHQLIISKLLEASRKSSLKSSILSFNPHPFVYFKKSKKEINITTIEYKKNLFSKYGISIYIDFVFNSKLATLSAYDFVKLILVDKLNIKKIIVGSDFKFGKNRSGDVNLLKELSRKLNFEVLIIDTVLINNSKEKFSSSIIREQIKKGLFSKVNIALGRPWQMTGKVIKGDQRARLINFPTANFEPGKHILPMKGVYCVNVILNKSKYFGISNFGERPTVNGKKTLLETHIFEFNDDIYGKELTVEFLTFIRPEKKFENFEALTEQIKKDITLAKSYHKL